MDREAQQSFEERLLSYFEAGDAAAAADRAMRSYFQDGYTGSWFEPMAGSDPNRITAEDFVAVSMLGVEIPAHVAVWILDREGQAVTSTLLRDVPADVDIWSAGDAIEPDGALWQLWGLLTRACWPEPTPANGMGMTKLSKLLAAKRPRLVPVVDSVVSKILPSNNYWADFAQCLGSESARELVRAATPSAPSHLSLLRRIDIVLWMLNH